MNYSVSVLIVIFAVMVFLIQFGVQAKKNSSVELTANLVCTLSYTLLFILILAGCSSFNELHNMFAMICGGIPYVQDITDMGSYLGLWQQKPLDAAASFMDTVLVSFLLQLVTKLLVGGRGKVTDADRKDILPFCLLSVLASMVITLFLVNYLIKPSAPYRFVMSILGSGISLITIGKVTADIIKLLKKNAVPSLPFFVLLYGFFKLPIMKEFIKSVAVALGITIGLGVVEWKFGSLAAVMNTLMTLLIGLIPCALMIAALIYMCRIVTR